MDPTLYEEMHRGLVLTRGSAVEIKQNLALDFPNFPLKNERVDELLGPCDLELPSPELERFLLQQTCETTDSGASGGLSTPTTQILFPKSVTEEQEAYARGFIDALEQLHRSQGAPVGVLSNDGRKSGKTDSFGCDAGVAVQSHSLQNGLLPSCFSKVGPPVTQTYSATIHHLASGQMQPPLLPLHSTGTESVSAPFPLEPSVAAAPPAHFQPPSVVTLVEAPQTVPRLGDTPPLSPINMDDQEQIKLERKRARNRMAARKCRTRKLEQIATLEIRVNELKSQNAVLASSASALKGEVVQLERQLREHVTSGSCYAGSDASSGYM